MPFAEVAPGVTLDREGFGGGELMPARKVT